MKSNKGVAEEVERLSAYLPEDVVFCPNDKPNKDTGEVCSNHANRVPVGTKKPYQRWRRNFGQQDKRSPCPHERLRKQPQQEHDEKDAAEPHGVIQGAGGVGGAAERQDAGGTGAAV